MADRPPEALLPSPSMPEVSKLSLEDNEVKAPKRSGRGTFTFSKQGLYSDQQDEESFACDSLAEVVDNKPENNLVTKNYLDPPRQRPKTSARTAHRLIAQELGLKMPSIFGSSELRKQEDARRNRIVTRQNLRDEAWRPDDIKLLTCRSIMNRSR